MRTTGLLEVVSLLPTIHAIQSTFGPKCSYVRGAEGAPAEACIAIDQPRSEVSTEGQTVPRRRSDITI